MGLNNEQVIDEAGTSRVVDILVRKYVEDGLMKVPDTHVCSVIVHHSIMTFTVSQESDGDENQHEILNHGHSPQDQDQQSLIDFWTRYDIFLNPDNVIGHRFDFCFLTKDYKNGVEKMTEKNEISTEEDKDGMMEG